MNIPALSNGHGNGTDTTRLAHAVTEVQRMHDELTHNQTVIGQLSADLHQERNRSAMWEASSDRYRYEALRFRDKLIELATLQTNISLECQRAESIVAAVRELLEGHEKTPAPEAIDQLEADLVALKGQVDAT